MEPESKANMPVEHSTANNAVDAEWPEKRKNAQQKHSGMCTHNFHFKNECLHKTSHTAINCIQMKCASLHEWTCEIHFWNWIDCKADLCLCFPSSTVDVIWGEHPKLRDISHQWRQKCSKQFLIGQVKMHTHNFLLTTQALGQMQNTDFLHCQWNRTFGQKLTFWHQNNPQSSDNSTFAPKIWNVHKIVNIVGQNIFLNFEQSSRCLLFPSNPRTPNIVCATIASLRLSIKQQHDYCALVFHANPSVIPPHWIKMRTQWSSPHEERDLFGERNSCSLHNFPAESQF